MTSSVVPKRVSYIVPRRIHSTLFPAVLGAGRRSRATGFARGPRGAHRPLRHQAAADDAGRGWEAEDQRPQLGSVPSRGQGRKLVPLQVLGLGCRWEF